MGRPPWGAHRLAYALTHGAIPNGLFVCHRCDNPKCCNPKHLFLGTPLDNVSDCVRKGRRAKTKGHYNDGAANSHAKLSGDDVGAIRRRVASGERQTAIAKEFGVDKGTVWRLVHGRTWTSG
jgi:hypothetical protein